VLAGDFNTDSQRWYPRCTERRDATQYEEIIDEYGLVIRNDNLPTHYRTRHDSMGESVIDLTLPNRPFGKWIILHGIHATGSDHKIVEWELEIRKQEEAGRTQVVKWNLAAISQKDVEVAEELRRMRAKEKAHLGTEITGDEVESEAEWCPEALSKVLNATAMPIMICTNSKRWWNGKIKEKRSQLVREKKEGAGWQ
jgi:hypothetical protein